MSSIVLERKILAHMEAGPPDTRIFRRQDFDGFGPTDAVDQALDRLAQARKIGSPAAGVWFPLHFAAGLEHPIPHASLRRLATTLLHREGVTTCASVQERDHSLFHETDGREGVWGVPNFEAIGVDQPVPLTLWWNQGRIYTEYEGRPMTTVDDFGFTATAIHEPGLLLRRAEQVATAPGRVEKDICVNVALKGLGEAPWPSEGCLLFAGGTSLTKAWDLSPRFSEDLDFWYLDRAFPPDLSEDRKQAVHAHLVHAVQQWVLPGIPGSAVNPVKSRYRAGMPVQRVFVDYPSVLQDDRTGTLKIEVMFSRFVPGWEARSIRSLPALAGPVNSLVNQYPCVMPWATMLGKLSALTLMHPGRDVQDMRHVHDLGAWLGRSSPTPYCPLMVRQGFAEHVMRNLLDGLLPTLDHMVESTRCRDVYQDYVSAMYPGNRTFEAPAWEVTLQGIRRLWEAMCASDWENPIYEPGPVTLPNEADFRDSGPRTVDRSALSTRTEAMRAVAETARDPEAESYAEYWRHRYTRDR